MTFQQLVNEVNGIELKYMDLGDGYGYLEKESRNAFKTIAKKVPLSEENFSEMEDAIYGDGISEFDMTKLPLLIQELFISDSYISNSAYNIILSCMLLEASWDRLEDIPDLSAGYAPLVPEKFDLIRSTMVRLYELPKTCDQLFQITANVILKGDPKLESFSEEEKERLILTSRKKLARYLELFQYAKTVESFDEKEKEKKLSEIKEKSPITLALFHLWEKFDKELEEELSDVWEQLMESMQALVNLTCYMGDAEISDMVDRLDRIAFFGGAIDFYLVTYKITNHLEPLKEKLDAMTGPADSRLIWIYRLCERLGVQNVYLKDITQKDIATSSLVSWLQVPMELGEAPDSIECLGDFIHNEGRYFAFAFEYGEGRKLGISGPYPAEGITAGDPYDTFSGYEPVEEDWKKQAFLLFGTLDEWREYDIKQRKPSEDEK